MSKKAFVPLDLPLGGDVRGEGPRPGHGLVRTQPREDGAVRDLTLRDGGTPSCYSTFDCAMRASAKVPLVTWEALSESADSCCVTPLAEILASANWPVSTSPAACV